MAPIWSSESMPVEPMSPAENGPSMMTAEPASSMRRVNLCGQPQTAQARLVGTTTMVLRQASGTMPVQPRSS